MIWDMNRLKWDGHFGVNTEYCVSGGKGTHYVYVWKHAWGDPFYVGSGKGDRCTTKSGRQNEFFLHLDKADAVVYKILSGVDSRTARLFEKYVSINLVEAGYTLANRDNNPKYIPTEYRESRVDSCKDIDKHMLAYDVRESVLKILVDYPDYNYLITEKFISEYGVDYFSRNYIK